MSLKSAAIRSQKGLTLIELLITIAVLAIVSAIAAPITVNVVEQSRYNALIRSLHEVTTFVEKWNTAGGTITQDVDNMLRASFPDTPNAEEIENLIGYTLVGTGTAGDPYLITLVGETAPYPVVTYEQTGSVGEDATFVRDDAGVTLNFPRANWQSLKITYNPGGGYTSVNTFKGDANGTVNGVVTKVSNTQIQIALSTSTSFALEVNFNGGSTGKFFFV